MAFTIQEHEQLVARIFDEICAADPTTDAVWQIGGTAGSGKRSLLNQLSRRLTSSGITSIRMSAPSNQYDSVAIASMRLASGLNSQGLIEGDFSAFTDVRRTWDDKFSIIRSAVDRGATQITLLCDEPGLWLRDSDGEGGKDAYQANGRRFVDWLWNEMQCRRIITGWAPDQRPRPRFVVPKRITSAATLLSVSEYWGVLETVAAELAQKGGQRLSGITPLSLRLLVCLAAIIGSDRVLDELSTTGGAKHLAERLASSLTGSHERRGLVKTWARLALVRGSIERTLYESIREPHLDPVDIAILERGFLDADGDAFVLPRPLQGSIDPLHVLADARAEHGQLSEQYRALATAVTDISKRCLYEMEGFHHGVLRGDPTQPIQGEPFFVDQLHAAGAALSYVFHDHRSAAVVFERAVALDPNDDYGHHYLAFNLDWLASDIDRVDWHYRQAIELNREHPWWWSRWICFLVTIGRGRHAQVAWRDAIDALSVESLPDDSRVFEALHLWVARLLLHRAQLDFSEQVLNLTPSAVRKKHPGFRALDRLLTALREAERGRGVFPLSVPPREWWRQMPHLDFPPQIDGHPLIQWNPARVEQINGDSIRLVVGKKPIDSAPPTYGTITVDLQRFNTATLDARVEDLAEGRFLELAFYGNQGMLRIRCHPDTAWRDLDLPPFVPADPRRYLKKGDWSA